MLKNPESGYWARWFGICIQQGHAWRNIVQNVQAIASRADVPPHEILLGEISSSVPFLVPKKADCGYNVLSHKVREACMG